MVSFRLVVRDFRLKIPDFLPASVAGIFRGGGTTSQQASHRHYKSNRQPPALQKQQLKQPLLKMAATDAGDKLGIHNLRPRPTSPEDTIYINYIILSS